MRLPLIFSQTTVPFIAPFDYNRIIADAESAGWTLVVVSEYEIRSKQEGMELETCDEANSILTHFLILIFGHLQSRSFVKT